MMPELFFHLLNSVTWVAVGICIWMRMVLIIGIGVKTGHGVQIVRVMLTLKYPLDTVLNSVYNLFDCFRLVQIFQNHYCILSSRKILLKIGNVIAFY